MAISDDIQNINGEGIDETFPLAGQDNDTQGFRNNFDLIRLNTISTKSALTALDNETAKTVANNDFNGFELQNATLLNVVEHGREGTFGDTENPGTVNVDFAENGYKQFYTANDGVADQTFIIGGLPATSNDKVLTGSIKVFIKAEPNTALTATFKKSSAEFSQDPGTFYIDETSNLTLNTDQVDLSIPANGVGMVEISYIVSTTRTVFIRELAQFTKIDPTLVNG